MERKVENSLSDVGRARRFWQPFYASELLNEDAMEIITILEAIFSIPIAKTPQKEPSDSNLVFLDWECRESILMIIQMFYGRDRAGIEHLYDDRAGEGLLSIETRGN